MTRQNATGAQPGMLTNLLNEMFAAWRLVFDGRVPMTLKLMLPIAAVAYWFWPIDLMPGLPFDDVAVLLVALHFFVKLAEEGLAKSGAMPADGSNSAAGSNSGDGQVVDTTWQRVE